MVDKELRVENVRLQVANSEKKIKTLKFTFGGDGQTT